MSKCEVRYVTYEDILPKHLRDSCNQTDDWYITKCPQCLIERNYQKEKLYISKSLDYAYCHRCNRVFLDKYVVFTNPELKLTGSFSEYLNNIRCTDHLDSFKGMDHYYNASEEIDEKGIHYFKTIRNNEYVLREYKSFKLRFAEDGIYIPFIFSDVPKYYTKRLYEPKTDMKYFLPPIKSKPFYLINRYSDRYVICEGVFDAMMISVVNKTDNVIAVQGSTMTSAQINSLRDMLPDYITVWLDDTELSMKLRDKLRSVISYCDYKIIESPDGSDPEELILTKLHSNE